MRTARTFTIEQDLAERLRNEENQSDLINQLIRDYYKTKDFEGLSKEQLKKELKIRKMQQAIEEFRKNG